MVDRLCRFSYAGILRLDPGSRPCEWWFWPGGSEFTPSSRGGSGFIMLGLGVLRGEYSFLAIHTLACRGLGLVGFGVRIFQVLVYFSVVGGSVFVLHFPRPHSSVSLDSCAVSSRVFDFAWTSKNQNCRLSLICLHELLASCHFDLQFQNLNLKFS